MPAKRYEPSSLQHGLLHLRRIKPSTVSA